MPTENSSKTSVRRPPVVTLLGHVDHGKTSLLSKIKAQDLTKKEFGGISQHTNAYQVTHKLEGEPREITFIDTPGHKAFSQMRSRGGEVADLVILVVAADDGVQPQTKEAISFARDAGVEIMVALNKMDLEHAQPEKAKRQLSEEGLNPEDWGGQTTVMETSAETGKGVEELLDMILLWAETSEITSDPQGELQGVVIESHMDTRRGPVATVLVKNGTLKKGEEIYGGKVPAKVKAIFVGGEQIKEAGPSVPAEVLGFKAVPSVGAKVGREKSVGERSLEKGKECPISMQENEKVLNLVLKADTVGTAQALEATVDELKLEDFETQIIQSGVGEVTESDVRLAADCGARIYGFNVGYSLGAENLAEELAVPMESFNIIYKLVKRVNEVLKKKKTRYEGQLPGMGEVIKVFQLPLSGDKVAGTRVVAGAFELNDPVFVTREGEEIHRARIKSIESKREEVEKAVKGDEVGLYLKPQYDAKVGDLLEVL